MDTDSSAHCATQGLVILTGAMGQEKVRPAAAIPSVAHCHNTVANKPSRSLPRYQC